MNRMLSILTRLAPAAAAALMPSLAFAHSGGSHVHGLLSGLQHPLAGIDHLLAMLAVGVIAARTGGRAAILMPACFIAAMVAGAVLGTAGIGLPSLESGIALSLVVFGAMVALAKPVPPAFAATLAALFGLFHGNAHGLEIPETVGGMAYAIGFLASTSVLHATGVLAALTLRSRPAAIRAAGIGTSLVGVALTAQLI
ncbi:HupE/UreJ family protein [Mesorhizobium sp.]|uniref:HupE/UreJ family protein n=1 Tax=Mesorhizobium sp. TaxID=1871066 RepID=UPI000FE2BD28|nr:HupE/UreJ family protein [Mesorhizobium sp.]RWA71684.1 MAG: HupE/UreJ family protein [Mesorhizobium sp.]RWC00980.1 MAG: HupE/UreJ family protein [Mesorhizobium sp.]RWG81206.1 MAG: HupE/UreJ family protein [Mesorhizobium sp.]RWG88762.1 MAG: HupE/UreJ family protein [Mesorhizobium sp.]RWK09096.1 MAG: HupE/UreJ family protein [Mesorhizobium sp.]